MNLIKKLIFSMKVEFNDEVLKGEILIDRQLTVFTGRNGTGKSYAAADIKKKSRHAEFGRLSPMRNAEIENQRKGVYLSKKIGELVNRLETEMFGFEIKAKDGVETVAFGGRTIDVQKAPRSIEMFAPIILNLKYGTFDGGLVVLDTPEAYQDPHNQILIARFIARLANAGLKIVLVTHSNYIIRELNNMIMLSGVKDRRRAEFAEIIDKYAISPECAISTTDVRAYNFEGGEIKETEITRHGFEVKFVDDVIDRILQDRKLQWSDKLNGLE